MATNNTSDTPETAIQHPRYVINDALTLAYGDDGTGEMYWAEGADLIVTMLIEAGLVPPEFDAPMAPDSGS